MCGVKWGMTASTMLRVNKYILFYMICWSASSQAADVSRRQLLIGLGTAAVAATTPHIPVLPTPLSSQAKEALIQNRAAFYMGEQYMGEDFTNHHIGSIFQFFGSESPRFESTIDYLNKWFGGQFKFFETHPGQWDVLLKKIHSADALDMARIEVALAEHFNIPIEHVAEEVECIRYPSHDEKDWHNASQFRKFKAMGPEFQDFYLQLLEVSFPKHAQKLKNSLMGYRFTSTYKYAFRRWDVEQKMQQHFKVPMEHILEEVERIHSPYYKSEARKFPSMGRDFFEMYIRTLSKYDPNSSRRIQMSYENYEKSLERKEQERILTESKLKEYRAQRALELANEVLSTANTALNVANGVSVALTQQNQFDQLEGGANCQPQLLPAPTEQSMKIIDLEPEHLEVIKQDAH